MRFSDVLKKERLNNIFNVVLTNKYISAFLLILVVVAVSVFAHRSLSGLTESDLSGLPVGSLILSFCLISMAYLNRFFFWTILTASFRLKAPFLLAFRAFFYSLLGRYIPGKAGLFLFRIKAYEGSSRKKVGAALITEYIATFLAACLLIITGTMFIPVTDHILTRWIPGGLLVLFIVLLNPAILKKSINALIGFAGKEPLDVFPATKTIVAITSGYILSGLLHGLALFTLLRVFSPMGFEMYPIVTGAYFMAGLVGIAAFFAPGGIGVREGVLFLLLSFVIDSQSVVISAAIMRLLTLLSELVLAGCSGFSYYLFGRKGTTDET
ncbi:MAG: flippase-like domain-containing protein [Candidatus Fermentibacteraceae bacterium]|nr:flippase-like domain-containing protein [Candidatus Fermentibacteraceae bacterium]